MEIQDRTLDYAAKIIKFASKLSKTSTGTILSRQLVRSGTSIGANMEEADGASSKKDFTNKVTIARKEARETRYWLRLIKKTAIINNKEVEEELNMLTKEASELTNILSSIINKAKK